MGDSNSSGIGHRGEVGETYQPDPNMSSQRKPQRNTSNGQSGVGIAAFIFAIIPCTFFVGIVLAIIDLAIGDKRKKHSLAVAGLIIGIVWIALLIATAASSKGSAEVKEIANSVEAELDNKAEETVNGKSQEEDTDVADAGTATATSGSKTTIEESLIYEGNGVRITALGLTEDMFFGDGLQLKVENTGATNIGVQCNTLVVNNYMMNDGLFVSDVAPGKASIDTLTFSMGGLKASGVDAVGEIDVSFHIYNGDTYEEIANTEEIVIKTSDYGKVAEADMSEGTVLYDENGLKVVGKSVDENSFWGAGVVLYTENNLGRDIMLQCDNMSVNNMMVTPYFSPRVNNGRKSVDAITLMSTELQEQGITSIDSMELTFNIIDPNTYQIIAKSSPVTFNAK